MGELIFLLPALFLTICISFIIAQSFYQRWKLMIELKKKREVAKISLVDILEMSNSTITPRMISSDKPHIVALAPDLSLTKTQFCTCDQSSQLKTFNSIFDPRNPNVLSSVVTFKDEMEDSHPPPCYEDLYGSELFFPPKYSPPTVSYLVEQQKETPILHALSPEKRSQSVCGGEVFLQASPSMERRNSSAVLYI